MTALAVLANLTVFALSLAWLLRRRRRGAAFSPTVLLTLLLGGVLGAALQAAWGADSAVVARTLDWVGIVGGGYVRLLQMIVMPLVMIMILSSVTGLDDARALGRISGGVLSMLMLTTALSAAIGVGVARLFRLSADGLVRGVREVERGEVLTRRAADMAALDLPALLQSFIPANPFEELTGAHPTSIIAVVVFASLLGIAALALRREDPVLGRQVAEGVEVLHGLVMRLVRMVIRLTPYGVLALMVRVVARSSPADIAGLARFVIASYVGLALILLMHAAFLALSGQNVRHHARAIWPVLTFAFSSRSSAAAIPLNVETQVDRLGVSPAVANFSAGFGATIGQNGCAGLYPAMLAVMIAPSVGIDPLTPAFVVPLLIVTTLGSFGIAGVGGGATIAALVVLSTMNLPVALAGLLISVEPLIDMGRTAINVSGSITAGAVTSRVLGLTDASTADPGGAPPRGGTGAGDASTPAVA